MATHGHGYIQLEGDSDSIPGDHETFACAFGGCHVVHEDHETFAFAFGGRHVVHDKQSL